MTRTTAEQMRAWRGPAVLRFGLPTMLLQAPLWAVLAICLWTAMRAGLTGLPTGFDPVPRHGDVLPSGAAALHLWAVAAIGPMTPDPERGA